MSFLKNFCTILLPSNFQPFFRPILKVIFARYFGDFWLNFGGISRVIFDNCSSSF